jgi:flavin-dependent dehydrogenase
MLYDIAIIGAGPAGSTLARLLSPQYKVALIDKKNLSHPEAAGFRKPCGGLLAPDAQKAMARFGLNLPNDILADPQIFAVKTIDIPSRMVRLYQRHYLNFDRHRFDLWLASLVGSQVDIIDQAICTEFSQNAGAVRVNYRKNDGAHTLQARYLVGADGSGSLVRRRFCNCPIRQYIAIQQWFTSEETAPFYHSIFDPEVTDCYAWINAKNGCLILGAALDPATARKNFEALKLKLRDFGYHLEHPIRTEGCLVSRPAALKEIALGNGPVFLLGEAAGFISPSSLEGVSYAMDSADALSQALNGHFEQPGPTYRKKTFKLKLKLLSKLAKSPFIYRPGLRKLVMKSGLQSIRPSDMAED